jgi:hypothetical protein
VIGREGMAICIVLRYISDEPPLNRCLSRFTWMKVDETCTTNFAHRGESSGNSAATPHFEIKAIRNPMAISRLRTPAVCASSLRGKASSIV